MLCHSTHRFKNCFFMFLLFFLTYFFYSFHQSCTQLPPKDPPGPVRCLATLWAPIQPWVLWQIGRWPWGSLDPCGISHWCPTWLATMWSWDFWTGQVHWQSWKRWEELQVIRTLSATIPPSHLAGNGKLPCTFGTRLGSWICDQRWSATMHSWLPLPGS